MNLGKFPASENFPFYSNYDVLIVFTGRNRRKCVPYRARSCCFIWTVNKYFSMHYCKHWERLSLKPNMSKTAEQPDWKTASRKKMSDRKPQWIPEIISMCSMCTAKTNKWLQRMQCEKYFFLTSKTFLQ